MNLSTDDIARVAHAIWESEGKPEGRDVEHWLRAKEVLREGRAAEYSPAGADRGARPVQPGPAATPPGIVPETKDNPGPDLRKEPGGRLAKQVAHLPEGPVVDTPGPRNPEPTPRTNAEGYASIPSVSDAAAMAQSDDPAPPPAKGGRRVRRNPRPD
jgi:Protein of unknown function (DUF2934)